MAVVALLALILTILGLAGPRRSATSSSTSCALPRSSSGPWAAVGQHDLAAQLSGIEARMDDD